MILGVAMGALGRLAAAVVAFVSPTYDAARLSANVTLSNGNMTLTSATSQGSGQVNTTIPAASDVYWQTTIGAAGVGTQVGVSKGAVAADPMADANAAAYSQIGTVATAGSAVAGNASYTAGDRIGVRFNSTTNVATFYKNDAVQPITATCGAGTWRPITGVRAGNHTLNFEPAFMPVGTTKLSA